MKNKYVYEVNLFCELFVCQVVQLFQLIKVKKILFHGNEN